MTTTTTQGSGLTIEDLKNLITYFTQRNNQFDGNIACFPTSMAMAITALNGQLSAQGEAIVSSELQRRGKTELEGSLQLDDKIWLVCNAPSIREALKIAYPSDSWIWGANQFPDKLNQVYAVEAYVCNNFIEGVAAKLNYSMTLNAIKNVIDLGGVSVCGTGMYGGHIISVFGLQYNDNGTVDYMVGDPYGDYQHGWAANLTTYPASWGVFQSMFGVELYKS